MRKTIMGPALVVLWGMAIAYMSMGYMMLEKLAVHNKASQAVITQLEIDMIYKSTGIALIATFILYIFIGKTTRVITEPIKKLTEEAKAFAKGEYIHNVKNYEVEEVQTLAQAFDDMGEKLYRTIRKLQYQKTKAETILNDLDEAIIILDEKGYITEVNASVQGILKVEDIKRYHIGTVLRDTKIRQMIEVALKQKQYNSCEILRDEKILHFRIAPISKGDKHYGFIISVRDITQTRQLEELRYQFVSNVTHELKTPLTSIQGFVETLKDGAIDNRDIALRFLDIIDIEAKRLYRLIQDILLLSEIENMENNYGMRIELTPIVEEVIAILQQEADKKQIEIIFNHTHDIVFEHASADYMKQVMMNMLSNALKYTDTGTVTITTECRNDEYVISIQDTGIGMPKESLGRIFERFYRVDKSRSRKSGGTGLGLSIVKHIVELYKGTIKVESTEHVGTTFTITFKKN